MDITQIKRNSVRQTTGTLTNAEQQGPWAVSPLVRVILWELAMFTWELWRISRVFYPHRLKWPHSSVFYWCTLIGLQYKIITNYFPEVVNYTAIKNKSLAVL